MLFVIVKIPGLIIRVLILIQGWRKIRPVETRERLQRAEDPCKCPEREDKSPDIILRLQVPCVVRRRGNGSQILHLLIILPHIVIIGLEQVSIRVTVPGIESQGVILCSLDITVRHDLAKLFGHLVYTIRPAVRLHE